MRDEDRTAKMRMSFSLPSHMFSGSDQGVDHVAAFLSNSRTLFTLDNTGRILRWFWPHIDYDQHISLNTLGLEIDGKIFWQDDLNLSTHPGRRAPSLPPFSHQYHKENSLATVTTIQFPGEYLVFTIRDVLARDQDLLIRNISLQNQRGPRRCRLWNWIHFQIGGSHLSNAVYYDDELDAVIAYRKDVYLGFTASEHTDVYTCAPCPGDAGTQVTFGIPISQGNVFSLVSWDLGEIAAENSKTITLVMGAARSKEEIQDLLRSWRGRVASIENEASRYYMELTRPLRASYGGTSKLKAPPAGESDEPAKVHHDRNAGGSGKNGSMPREIEEMLEKSVLVLDGLRDSRGGGFIAAPEFDQAYSKSGGYGYCWGRDASFITMALDNLGFYNMCSDFFLKWAGKAQSPDGSFLHRHYSDGLLAPSWGFLQLDETASLLVASHHHALKSHDRAFIKGFEPIAIKASRYLLQTINPDDGLTLPCIDLWEERTGKHLYTSAAVAAGLYAGAFWANSAGLTDLELSLLKAHACLKERICQLFWDQGSGSFVRTLDLHITDSVREETLRGKETQVRKVKDHDVLVLRKDETLDASFLGLLYPYRILDAEDDRFKSTMRRIEAELTCPRVGGILRYVGDRYVGGNPWIITTLWLGLSELASGQKEKARQRLQWALDHATSLGFLPEQVDKNSGEPMWVIPLAWSHAMFILLAVELYGRP